MEISLLTAPRASSVSISLPNARKTVISCITKGAYAVPMDNKVNFYDMLSLGSKNAGLPEIKRAYRSMALQFHPDVCPPTVKEESTRRFVELQKAYETLSDPVSREQYDYELCQVDSVSFRGRGDVNHVGNRRCSREVWEDQLSQLKQRSHLRSACRRKGIALMHNML